MQKLYLSDVVLVVSFVAACTLGWHGVVCFGLAVLNVCHRRFESTRNTKRKEEILEALKTEVDGLKFSHEQFAKQVDHVKEMLSKGTLAQAFATQMPRSLK